MKKIIINDKMETIDSEIYSLLLESFNVSQDITEPIADDEV
jgi:hypothetical protein